MAARSRRSIHEQVFWYDHFKPKQDDKYECLPGLTTTEPTPIETNVQDNYRLGQTVLMKPRQVAHCHRTMGIGDGYWNFIW